MSTLRLATAADAEAIAAIYAPSVDGAATSFERVAPTAAEMRARIAATLEIAPWLVCDTTASDGCGVIGFAYACRHRERAAYQWSVDASVYIRGDQHRRGVARALYASLFALLRLQGFHAVHAGIALPNAASVGLHEGLGFRAIGVYPAVGYKLGAWRDVGWWQLRLRDRGPGPEVEPPPPLTLAEAQSLPGWSQAMAAGDRWLADRRGDGTVAMP